MAIEQVAKTLGPQELTAKINELISLINQAVIADNTTLQQLKNVVENVQTLGILSANTSIDTSAGNVATATIGAAITLSLTANAATGCRVFTIILTNGGAYAVTWASSIKWAEGAAPVLTAAGKDILTFMTTDNGATWYGAMNGSAFA